MCRQRRLSFPEYSEILSIAKKASKYRNQSRESAKVDQFNEL